MREWVHPTLRSIRPDTVDEKVWEIEIAQTCLAWQRIANLFIHCFSSVGMVEILGSVFCDLPKDVFDRLFEMNPFFILLRGPAMVQQLNEARQHTPVVIFSQGELRDMTWEGRRATVAHELAHIVKEHFTVGFSLDDPWNEKKQAEADNLCREWGFEIDAVRVYLKQKGEKENG